MRRPLAPAAPVIKSIDVLLTQFPRLLWGALLRLHGCLHSFENHRILKRREIVEGSLFKRIFAEECEYPSRTDLPAAREGDVLSRQIAGCSE